ncbi:hypothetical protein HELRODRAFT_169246 [Helobdella robusta]|uniref:Uncharacterized protein n=1 Tax=Helobdella robusta TaxID=6412 RepID=T1F1M5_HELRO|nr:hypothetical protein HELRODRAFT_169246 [Helobdella robusta]ESO08408.1 hypothetical protein HELRODRAFT_169246 [Helobdella robusta]
MTVTWGKTPPSRRLAPMLGCGSDQSEIHNSQFLGDRNNRSYNETSPNFLSDRAGPTENILDSRYQAKRIGAEWFKRMKKSNTVLRLATMGSQCIVGRMFIPEVRNMQDKTEDRMKAVGRQMNSLRQSLDVLRGYGVRQTVPQVRGEKVGGFSKLTSIMISDHVSEIIMGLDWLVNKKVSWKFDEARVTVGNKNRVVKLVTKGLSNGRLRRIYCVKVQIPTRAELDVLTKLVICQPYKLTLTLWARVKNKLDQQPQQENLANIKTIIDELTMDAPEEGRHKLSELLNNFVDVFSDTCTEIGVAKGVYHRINTEHARPIKQQLRRYPPVQRRKLAREARRLGSGQTKATTKPNETSRQSITELTGGISPFGSWHVRSSGNW